MVWEALLAILHPAGLEQLRYTWAQRDCSSGRCPSPEAPDPRLVLLLWPRDLFLHSSHSAISRTPSPEESSRQRPHSRRLGVSGPEKHSLPLQSAEGCMAPGPFPHLSDGVITQLRPKAVARILGGAASEAQSFFLPVTPSGPEVKRYRSPGETAVFQTRKRNFTLRQCFSLFELL